ncbi:MAG: archaetidylserine decarboxylase [Gammaproteobacteria bacterium]|jgi:phosphatidylserine decarboxylase
MPSRTPSPVTDRLKSWPQYLLPHHPLSRLVHRLTRVQTRWFKNWLIGRFVRRFDVDMTEAQVEDPLAYASFNDFFTRSLKSSARPLEDGPQAVVCPVDGTVSQTGRIDGMRVFQAKGRSFDTVELLGGDRELAAGFDNGAFATLYLSPRDYHRIHMPADGTLRRMIHVPGRLFSVNPPTTRTVPRLFARNERVVTVFDTEFGRMALVLVGALFVSSIETVWAGEITPPHGHAVRQWHYDAAGQDRISIARGAEVGRFNMGSTVILLFERDRVTLEDTLAPDQTVRVGRRLARATLPD